MVTYHRLIRFLPSGQVMSLLSTEHPSTLVPLLDERLRMKGLHHGRWELVVEPSLSSNALEGGAIVGPAVVQIVDLGEPDDLPTEDDPLHPSAKVFKRDKKRKSKERKYDFEMSLSLGSTSRGRWNKLTMGEYVSTNRATGEILPIKLVNQGPFYFSKCVSPPHLPHFLSLFPVPPLPSSAFLTELPFLHSLPESGPTLPSKRPPSRLPLPTHPSERASDKQGLEVHLVDSRWCLALLLFHGPRKLGSKKKKKSCQDKGRLIAL